MPKISIVDDREVVTAFLRGEKVGSICSRFHIGNNRYYKILHANGYDPLPTRKRLTPYELALREDPDEIKTLREDYRRGRYYEELHPEFTPAEIARICADIEPPKRGRYKFIP